MPSILNATTTTGLVSSGDNSGSLQLATNNGTAALTIDTSQNVGIGTASPTSSLDVIHSNGGSARIRGVSTDGARLQFFNNSATTNGFHIGQGFSTGTDNVAYLSNQANADMIFRTNATERMRITSTGDMFIGRTSDTDVAGISLIRDGFIRVNRDSAACMVINRNVDNGTLVSFRQAGNTVGTVDVTTTGTTYTGTNGITFTATQTASAGANTLDDYEEGTWTPGISGRTFSAVYGMYRKIGSCVYVYGECNTINSAITDGTMTGLPFTTTNSGSAQYGGYAPLLEPANWTLSAGYYYLYIRFYKNSTTGQFLQGSGITHNNGVTINTGGNFRFSGFYFVD